MLGRITVIVPFIFLAFYYTPIVVAQEPQAEERAPGEHLPYEWGVGAVLHTDGFGITARSIRGSSYYQKWLYEMDLMTMKHPKEVRTKNSYFSNSRSFVYGKINYLMLLRGGMGRHRVLNREPLWEAGVEVRMIYSLGVSMGITKPVYLYIFDDTQPYYRDGELVKYDPEVHGIFDIQGRGPIAKGFDELAFHPGGYAKLGFNFEFGETRRKPRALEAGAKLDLYPEKIPLMAFTDNKHFFLSFYISYFMGGRYN